MIYNENVTFVSCDEAGTLTYTGRGFNAERHEVAHPAIAAAEQMAMQQATNAASQVRVRARARAKAWVWVRVRLRLAAYITALSQVDAALAANATALSQARALTLTLTLTRGGLPMTACSLGRQ